MNIKSLKIEGYKNLNIELIHNSDIIALIGNNGSGKSNLLEALSLIFRSLYKKSEMVSFDYCIEYENTLHKNIKIEKSKSKITFKVDNVVAISIDDFLPKKVVAIYSGEEDRLWSKIYFPIYDDFVKSINKSSQTGILTKTNQMPQMLYLNKYYWHLSLLSLVISDLPDNQDFVKNVLKIKTIDKIKFDFNTSNYKGYAGSVVLDFINIIDKKSEYTVAEFKKIIADNGIADADLFNYLYIANSPKGSKIVNDIIILYNEHLTIEDFSEGEKKLLLIKAAFEFAEQEDSLFILDEPDAHIHLNNKEQIVKTFEPYKKNRQIVITTHSPTVTQAIDDDKSLFMVSKGTIIERKKQEIISDLTDEFWNKHQQSSFLSSQKKLILLVEGKHDKLHIINAYNKLSDEYPTLDFDIFSLGGESKIHPFMNGLYEANIQNGIIYIGIYDNDGAGTGTLNKAGFEPDITNCGYRKLKKDKTEHNHYFAFPLIKPDGFTKDCTIENMFVPEKYEEAFKEGLNKSIGHFSNKSIEDINKDIKENSKNVLADNSKNFDKEDFIHFRKLFDLIKTINNLNKPNPKTQKFIDAVLKMNGTKEVVVPEIIETETEVILVDVIENQIAIPIKEAPIVYPSKTITLTKAKRTVTENQHLKDKVGYIKNIYRLLKAEILDKCPEIEIVPKVEYIAFKLDGKNIFDIKILKSKVILWANKKKGTFPDELVNLFIDCSTKGHHGNGDYELHFISKAEVEQIIKDNVIEKILKL
jgi:predicted ATP-dependent endonuclease of OLD family/predicted transport protein